MGITSRKSDAAVTVRVLRDGKPAPGQSIDFLVTSAPAKAKGTALSASRAVSDDEGLARVELTLGDKDGTYLVSSYLHGSVEVEPVVTQVRAMEPFWVGFLIFGLLGGLGLFLYGMGLAGDHLQKAAGEQMRVLIKKLTRNRVMAVLVGTVASGVLQSSSAATVMLVGFVSGGMMTLTQAIGVTIGAKVGVTITAQLLAFNISKFALAIVGAGAILIIAAGKRQKMMHIGSIILGFGLIFFGLSVMSGAMRPLRGMPEFASLLITFGESPGLAIIVGTAFTAIIQSAVATVGMSMALAAQGLLPLEGAIPLAIGASIGTCTTALLASLGASRDGKRVAWAHLIFSVACALIFWPLIGPFADLVRTVTAWMGSDSVGREIANGFMLFSVFSAILFLPLIAPLERLVVKLLPESDEEKPFGPEHINEAALTVPVMALEQAQMEVVRMAGILGEHLRAAGPAILAGDQAEIDRLIAADDKLDILEKAIRPFLARVAQKGLAEEAAARERALIYITADLEGAGDLLSKEVLHAGAKLAAARHTFSEEGAKDISTFHEKMLAKFDRVEKAIEEGDRALAERVLQLSFKERQLERRLRNAHLERLHAGGDVTVASSADHLTVLAGLASVGVKLDAVAEEILQEM